MASIKYKRHSEVSYEQELEILAEVYRLALESYRKQKQKAPESNPEPSRVGRVKHEKEVHHVEQRNPINLRNHQSSVHES